MDSFNPIAKQVKMEYIFIILLFVNVRKYSSYTILQEKQYFS